MLQYTICFIKKGNELLLLNRNKKPNMGKWNGVGGKIEKDESPYEGILREAFEETGIHLEAVHYAGNVVWKSESWNSGMYVFMADFPENAKVFTPLSTEEGILEWKSIDWVLDSDNAGIVSSIKLFLPKMLDGEFGLEHTFVYVDDEIIEYSASHISKGPAVDLLVHGSVL